jgi:peptide/nickel transport system permease protein
MLAFVGRRIMSAIPVFVIVALLVFSLLYFSPGDPALIIAGDQASPADVEKIRIALGLDQPFYVRLAIFFDQILHADLGNSIFSGLAVTHLIGQRIAPTLSLAVITILLSVGVAVPLGTVAAWKVQSVADRLAMIASITGFSVPAFVVAYLLIWLFAVKLEWLPVQGYTPIDQGIWPWLSNLILPALSVSLVYIALITRITRANVRTARAKGISDTKVVVSHALRNAAVPIATIVGIGIALLLGGVVVTETVFAIPGLGRLLVEAILRRDYPVIQGVILLLACIYIFVNLVIDVSYAFFDPRIRY